MTHNPEDNNTVDDEEELLDEETIVSGDPEELCDAPKGEPVTISELEKLTNEARDYKDKYLRALADGENLRKRLVKEKEDYCKYTLSTAIGDFLQPLDNLENALAFADQGSDEVKNWAVGFQMILVQFKEALKNQGVEKIETVGAEFDPHKHEAVEVEETYDKPAGIILEEFTRGYTMGDRIIRPARVKVSRKPTETDDSNNN